MNLTFPSIGPQDNQQNNIQQEIPSINIHRYEYLTKKHRSFDTNKFETWSVPA